MEFLDDKFTKVSLENLIAGMFQVFPDFNLVTCHALGFDNQLAFTYQAIDYFKRVFLSFSNVTFPVIRFDGGDCLFGKLLHIIESFGF